MYNALKSIVKRKGIFIAIGLQLTLGISLLNNVEFMKSVVKGKVDSVKNLVDVDKTYISHIQPEKISIEEGIDDYNPFLDLDKIIENLERLKERGIVEEYSSYYNFGLMGGSLSKQLVGAEELTFELEEEWGKYHTLLLDKEIGMRNNAEVKEGRKMEKEDFSKDYKKENIPIWIGSGLADKVKLGDTFKEEGKANADFLLENEDITFQVVGILKPNQYPLIEGKENIISGIFYSDNLVVFPTSKNFFDYSNKVPLFDLGLYVKLKNPEMYKIYEEEFKKNAKEFGYKALVRGVKEDIESTVGNLDRELNQTLILGTVLTFLSIIGIVSIMLGDVSRRYKEFGIKISQGATTRTIAKEITFEILITVVFATGISLIGVLYKHMGEGFPMEIIFIFTITIIILIPIIFKLRKLNIIDLVRGK